MSSVCVIGEGAWGTAIATLLAHNGLTVNLWCHDSTVMQSIMQTRYNTRYLPTIMLHERIKPTIDMKQALENVTWVFEAIPIQFLRSVLHNVKPYIKKSHRWVVLSKGIENETLLLPSAIIDEVLGSVEHKAALVGPSFASGLARQEITAVTLAATDCDIGVELQQLLANTYFRPYLSIDLIGAQVGGAIKNVIALATGMLEGAGFGMNAQAFILTRGLHEIIQIAHTYGGKTETVYGLSGIGDVVLSGMGNQSRNRIVGKRIGQGESLQQILKETGYISEGVNTTASVYQLMQTHSLELPICNGVYQVLYQNQTIQQMIAGIMSRPVEQECMNI